METKQLKLMNNKNFQILYIIGFTLVPIIGILLPYFLSFDSVSIKFTRVVILVVSCSIVLGFLSYFIIRKIYNIFYLFDENKIVKMKGENEITIIQWTDVNTMFYIKMRRLLLLEFGAGHLILYYNENGKELIHSIALSYGQVKRISNNLGKKIEIR